MKTRIGAAFGTMRAGDFIGACQTPGAGDMRTCPGARVHIGLGVRADLRLHARIFRGLHALRRSDACTKSGCQSDSSGEEKCIFHSWLPGLFLTLNQRLFATIGPETTKKMHPAPETDRPKHFFVNEYSDDKTGAAFIAAGAPSFREIIRSLFKV